MAQPLNALDLLHRDHQLVQALLKSFDDSGDEARQRELHDQLRRAEARKARPATYPGSDTERPLALRFDVPGFDKNLQELSCDAWAKTFEERRLVFVSFQETQRDGKQSNFFILDSPDREDG